MAEGYRIWLDRISTSYGTQPWSYSITQAKLNVGYYGLIHSFPITFFIALSILTIATAILWLSAERHQKLLLIQLLFLITALWLAPAFIGSHPHLGCAYRNLGLIGAIVEEGKILDMWYLSWPGAHIFYAMISELGAVNIEPAVNLLPFFMQLLWLFPLYVFLKNVLGEGRLNFCWAGLWLFSLANWIGQEYFSPQSIAFFLMLLLLALITSPSLWKAGSGSLPFLIAGGLIIAAMAITHLLTGLALACILAAFCIVNRKMKLVPLLVLCLLLVVCWDMTGGAHYLSRFRSAPVVAPAQQEVTAPGTDIKSATPEGVLVFDPDYIIETNIASSVSGSESHIAVVKARIAHSAIFAVLGAIGAILALIRSKQRRNTVTFLAMAGSLLLLVPLAKQFGWELVQRLYLYALPFMAYFGAVLLDFKRRVSAIILCLLLIVAVPLFIISHYGNQAHDYWSPGYVAGWHYVDDVKGNSDYPFALLSQVSWQDSRPVFADNFPEGKHYLAISRHDDAAYGFLYNQPQFVDEVWEWLSTSGDYDLIYSNPEYGVFVSK